VTPHLRRLTTAAAILLALLGGASFALGRLTRPTERDFARARSTAEVRAYRAAEREALPDGQERGYVAGVERGKRVGHRVAKARALAHVEALAAAEAAPAAASSCEGCGADSSSGSPSAYAAQPQSPSGDAGTGGASGLPSSTSYASSASAGSAASADHARSSTNPSPGRGPRLPTSRASTR
jgi:hypothetical protein